MSVPHSLLDNGIGGSGRNWSADVKANGFTFDQVEAAVMAVGTYTPGAVLGRSSSAAS
jgi:hypothetical protein